MTNGNEVDGSGPKIWASIGATINLGNYENEKVDIGISNVPVNASDEYLDTVINDASKTIGKAMNLLAEKMAKIKEYYGK